MRILANPLGAGKSGAVGIGLIELLANHTDFETLKDDLEMGPDSTLLCFNAEGDTDPVNYQEIIWHGKYPSIDE
jgi:diaminopropionate ammonia-lyase